MRTVYYDATRLLARSNSPTPTGIDRVDINYAYYFDKSLEYEVFFIHQNDNVFYLIKNGSDFLEALYEKWIFGRGDDFDFENFKTKEIRSSKRLLGDESLLLGLGGHDGVDAKFISPKLFEVIEKGGLEGIYINASHHGITTEAALQFYHFMKSFLSIKIIFYLHDIIPIDYPEYVREGDDLSHKKRVGVMSDYADLVLVNSQYTKNRFSDFCSSNNIRFPCTDVALIGVEESFLEKISLSELGEIDKNITDRNYFVYVSTIEPRKNHLLLLHIWRKMVYEQVENIPKLVLIGKRGWNNQNILDVLDRAESLKGHVLELSGISDEKMISILKGSRGLLYPSFEEGWGMPLVEAVAAKIPVMCSDIPAHRESGQELVEYISPLDGERWQELIIKAANSEKFRLDLVERYKNYKFPNWSDHFNSVEAYMNNAFSMSICDDLYSSEVNSSIKNYFEKVELPLRDCKGVDNRDGDILSRFLFKVFFGDPRTDKARRLARKFSLDPVKYMEDSKVAMLRKFGLSIKKYKDSV